MTIIKTVAVTAIVAVAGSLAAFSGLHLGQAPADASTAQPVKAKTTYTVTMTAKQFAQLMRSQNGVATQKAKQHARHTQRHAVHQSSARTYTTSSRSYSRSYSGNRSYGYRCYGSRGSYSGSHSGRCWGGGGCW